MPEVETSYHAASYMAKDMATWSGTRLSPDAALLPEQETIVARTDDLRRNNGIAAGAIRTLTDNVIGARLICKPAPDRIALKRDPKWAFDWSREVESKWQSFADSALFDAGQRHTFHSMTRLAYRSMVINGEALALPLWLSDRQSKWSTCFQMVHPARLSNPILPLPDPLNKVRGGIELDRYGAPRAYHIRKTHPVDFGGSIGLMIAALPDWERIPAKHPFGRLRVLHVYEQEEIGQTRGVPAFSSVARQFKMLDHYMREELRLAVLNSLVFAAIETPLDQASILELFDSSDNPMAAYQEAIKQWRVTMQGGAMIPIPPGTKIAPFLPQRQTSGLNDFASTMLRQIGAGLNLPYELLFRDFSQTNYSSARASLLEAWRYFMSCREFVISDWAYPIYEMWFEEAVNKGEIPDCTPQEFYANQTAWVRCKWIGPGRGFIDPLKEARAVDFRMKNGTTSLADEAAEQGHDWRDQMEQRAAENDLADELELPRPHMPMKAAGPAGGGAAAGVGNPPPDENAIDDQIEDAKDEEKEER